MSTFFVEKYINPFTDFGFKKLFGEEESKELLIDFLNQLLYEEQGKIVSLTYLNNEQLGRSELDRKAIFDLYCENEQGEKFIVELQKTKQNFFKDRSIYYATFPIVEQAKMGANWNFELKAVYTIAILDFVFDEDKNNPDKYLYKVKLADIETNKVFFDKLTFIYLEMPKFKKSLDELQTKFDKWLYILKNLSALDDIPTPLQDFTFNKLFHLAEISKFDQIQARNYENSLKYYRDLKNSIDTAFDEGKEEGLIEGLKLGEQKGIQQGIEIGEKQGFEKGKLEQSLQIAKNLKLANLPDDEIVRITGLTLTQIQSLI